MTESFPFLPILAKKGGIKRGSLRAGKGISGSPTGISGIA
ncbi:hypothetical protein B4135_3341 [Caldibacillus debilis]|uniref:Uncharacterized protein n=1 Tax=Caldibacillus debilis TaxID=301148 RepID=A0A150LH10_9BACI|nr:hypothetical protein B4135_3341 [Caldibacillus debilis]